MGKRGNNYSLKPNPTKCKSNLRGVVPAVVAENKALINLKFISLVRVTKCSPRTWHEDKTYQFNTSQTHGNTETHSD